MKTIGLIGGMSWESTASYYSAINTGVKEALGGLHSAKIVMYSVDFAEVEQLQHTGQWDKAGMLLADAARAVEAGGANFFLICTNTMHKVADIVAEAVTIPLVHIADATAEQLLQNGIRRVGLLRTRFTMEQAFYKDRLTGKYGIEVLVPDQDERQIVHDIIYNELCLGDIREPSRAAYLSIIDQLHARGADAVILGCTEIALLVQQHHTTVPLYDTTRLHAHRAVTLVTQP